MRKKITIVTLIASLLFIQGTFHLQVHASGKGDLEEIQQERKEIQNNLSAGEQKINELYDDMKALNEEVNRLDDLLQEKEAKVEEITYEIETTKEEIYTLQAEIDRLNASIEERFDLLKTRASSYQKSGGLINYIEVIFDSQSFGDFISRVTAVNQVMDSDAMLMEQLEADMELVEAHQHSTLEKLNDLDQMHEAQEAERAQIEQEKQQQETVKASLNDKRQELVAYVEQLEGEDTRLKTMEDTVKKEIAAAEAAERERQEEIKLAAAEKAKQEEQAQAAVVKTKSVEKKEEQKESKPVQVKKEEPAVNKPESKPTPKPSESDNKSFTVTSTAYTADCNGCSGVTSTGIDLKANPNAKVIAVDPSVIPLGSIVHVEGYGHAIAGDTGSAIRGNKIDVFVPTQKQATSWGVRTVKVTIQ
ncbi:MULTISPECIES: 3D domain-containing protein [unclassified Oceanobacillus]|uniref:PcsB-like coiled-coil domain-containing protein n=1 Tax=unclassified Oceanobacillus TaxID=2630292 RepID=UPI0012EC4A09|nr:3D domain-containing protein [Oceanobacillus sp. AG]